MLTVALTFPLLTFRTSFNLYVEACFLTILTAVILNLTWAFLKSDGVTAVSTATTESARAKQSDRKEE